MIKKVLVIMGVISLVGCSKNDLSPDSNGNKKSQNSDSTSFPCDSTILPVDSLNYPIDSLWYPNDSIGDWLPPVDSN